MPDGVRAMVTVHTHARSVHCHHLTKRNSVAARRPPMRFECSARGRQRRRHTPLHRIPHDPVTQCIICMREPIPESGQVAPRDIREPLAKIVGHASGRFTHDLEIPQRGMVSHSVGNELLERQPGPGRTPRSDRDRWSPSLHHATPSRTAEGLGHHRSPPVAPGSNGARQEPHRGLGRSQRGLWPAASSEKTDAFTPPATPGRSGKRKPGHLIGSRAFEYCPSWARPRTLLIQNVADEKNWMTGPS